jgi:hypothetical protein
VINRLVSGHHVLPEIGHSRVHSRFKILSLLPHGGFDLFRLRASRSKIGFAKLLKSAE